MIILIFMAISKFLPGSGWILVVVAIGLWIVCLAAVAFKAGRFGSPGASGPLNGFFTWVTQPTVVAGLSPPSSPSPQRPPPGVSTTEPICKIFLETELKKKVFGHDDICRELAASLSTNSDRTKRNGPLGCFIFVGPSKTGKIHLAKILSSTLNRCLFQQDMSQCDPSQVVKNISDGLQSNNNAVFLLTKFDQAPDAVQEKMLSFLSDEPLEGIHKREAVFILTCQSTHTAFDQEDPLDPEKVRNILTDAGAAPKFNAQILNVLSNKIMAFRKLKGLELATVIALAIEQHVNSFGISITPKGLDAALLARLTLECQKKENLGASEFVKPIVERHCDEQLSDLKKAKAKVIRLTDGQEKGSWEVLRVM